MISCFLLSNINRFDIRNIVEIGGGYCNFLRLNTNIINYKTWNIIDLPYVNQLQDYIIKNTFQSSEKIKLLSAYNYKDILDKNTDNLDIDLVIALHSLSELGSDFFLDYFYNVLIHAKVVLYSFNINNPSYQLYLFKNSFFEKHFKILNIMDGENENVKHIIYVNNKLL
jgi:hypothetical protein